MLQCFIIYLDDISEQQVTGQDNCRQRFFKLHEMVLNLVADTFNYWYMFQQKCTTVGTCLLTLCSWLGVWSRNMCLTFNC